MKIKHNNIVTTQDTDNNDLYLLQTFYLQQRE